MTHLKVQSFHDLEHSYNDNTLANILMLDRDFSAENSTNIVHQAPCNMSPFPKSKLPLCGRRFESIQVIKQNSLNELNVILEIEIQRYCEDWENRWHECVTRNGDYFESDQVDIAE
ncbi:hypothetical protein WH47_05941 [Habropoda laboriosa]|uniref:Histone-lysine N-methyltransferase SETMAR n=1 Tax=Habropoda laboriosa TaxID=597456 RepID=A0A0L7REL2_9HYME|nr:hypothetical protein WH47_05941 [Habropoda laboriosa]